MSRRKSSKSNYSHAIQWLGALIISLVICVFAYNYLGMPYRVVESFICSDYEEGEIIWLSKVEAGIRSPIVWNPFSSPENEFFKLSDYRRIGDLEIARFENIAFNAVQPRHYHPDKRLIYLGRAVGLPGDTLSIYRGTLFVNGSIVDSSSFEILGYEAHIDNENIDSSFWSKMKIKELISFEDLGDKTEITFASSKKEALVIAGHEATLSFSRLLEDRANPTVYQNGLPDQNGDNYGPVTLPKKGDTLFFDKLNIYHANLYSDFEIDNSVESESDSLWVWKHDYYFVLSDYRKKGHDSRFFGAIPEYLVLAKPGLTLIEASK